MLAFGIRYLNGFVAASEPDSHDRPEWPPHPGRFFMALAAAHFETGADASERKALEWLENLDTPPSIRAGEASPRALVTHYVPVNDRAGPAKGMLQSAPPLTRDHQPRTFARAWLDDDVTHLWWLEADPPLEIRKALESLCGKVTRIGHSSSLVHVWLAGPDEVGEPSWVPNGDRAEMHLRVARPGTLRYLERCFNGDEVAQWGDFTVAASNDADKEGQKNARKQLKERWPGGPPVRRRPELRLYEGYAPPQATDDERAAPGTVFNPHFVVRTLERESGPYLALDLQSVPQVVHRWREAILSQANNKSESVKCLLSGHDRDGGLLEEPHLAFVPLAFVGHPHSDGHLLGMGIVFPDEVPPDDRRQALATLARVDRLLLGRLGVWRVGTVGAAEAAWSLRSEVWTAHPGGATHWSTVTPLAFDRHPKSHHCGAYQRDVAAMITEACERIGLPQPRDVIVTPVSAHLGVPPAHQFPRLQRKDGSERRHAHAILVFEHPVRGPILLGAGRYRGFGVCRPLRSEEPTV
jgi:CRISPR-associated protein Csb2